eukprot:TRINITY_DN5426_c0_g1_i1.p1 TRINITY_DN5426_c0_g1~~TRINITY_DN5426_c0_g1_i1.p1  ORF type:complete len:291 (+),score=49.51 TRINITY_DN5426_c0_g1_i1:47-874(+)
MREFGFRSRYAAPFETIYDLLFADPTFKQYFHTQRADQGVVVSDWIKLDETSAQRMCFYKLKDNPVEKMPIQCIETQKMIRLPDTLEISSRIVPENSLGNIFRFEAVWNLVRNPDTSGCDLTIKGEVECTKKMWGVQGVVEDVLYKQAIEIHQGWIDLASEYLSQHAPNPSLPETNIAATSAPISNPEDLTLRQRSNTSKIGSGVSSSVRRAGSEDDGAVYIEVDVDRAQLYEMDEHDDSDLQQIPKRKLTRTNKYVALVTVLVGSLATLFFAFS